jgi:DNA-binding beta-propeller fold protein YncE
MRLPCLLLSVAACTASASEVAPPGDTVFFPTGMATAPDDSVLFVANANGNLQYDSGSIAVLDLSMIDAVASAWTSAQAIPSGCIQETDHVETLQCDLAGETTKTLFRTGAGVRIGNFATDVAVQNLGSGNYRVFVPTRGDPSIAWADWNGQSQALSCASTGGAFALCDDAHRLSFVHNDPTLAQMPPEPFEVFADSDYAIVTHLTTGAITLVTSPADPMQVQIADVVVGLFQPDPLTGLTGTTGVAGRTPTTTPGAPDLVYVGSRSEARVQTLTVGHPADQGPGIPPYIVEGEYFFLDGVGNNAGGSTDTRGMRFSPTGDLLYLINRKPAALQIVDTSLDAQGVPNNTPVGASALCRQPSQLAVVNFGDPVAGERAYVTCFLDGQIYVVDPTGVSSVEDVIDVGRGPYAVAAAPSRKKIYVTNFLENTIAVIDIAPTSTTRNRVVLRIGTPTIPTTTPQ